MNSSPLHMGRAGYAGLFFTALATLMYQILLTRIFSVTMFYHFAFLAISVAMFGMTVGALAVYLAPRVFADASAKRMLSLSTLLFAFAIPASFVVHLYIPIPYTDMKWEELTYTIASAKGAAAMAATYMVIAVPFTLSGVAICLALTKFPPQVSRLYGADLVGAAFGCVLVLIALNLLGDAPAAVFVVSAIAAFGALCFAVEANIGGLKLGSAVALIALTAIGGVAAARAKANDPLLRVQWIKGERVAQPAYEKWNSFSRIAISGDGETLLPPFGWGISETFSAEPSQLRLDLNIDGTAYTPIIKYEGDPAPLEHLKHDVTNMVHFIRRDAKVAIIGAGGGRDVLSALAFDQAHITAIEMNGDTVRAVNEVYGDYTGRLHEHPKVEYVVDEARSYIAGSDEQFDIIQASLVDTWAATAAGAFVLAENSLYTLEGWKTFLNKLTPEGVLTFSRFYPDGIPGEMYRMMSLGVRALIETGVENPGEHIVIIRHVWPYAKNRPSGIGTILVGKRPFTRGEIETLEHEARRLQFEVVYSPLGASDEVYQQIVDSNAEGAFLVEFPIDITPTTDNRPFFFQMLRLRDIFKSKQWYQGALTFNLKAVSVLGLILVIVVALTLVCVLLPLILTRKRVDLSGASPLLAFFAAIGLGFMLVEISQMQRLVVFLGHPIYSLAVVLFTMLLAGGVGSLTSHSIGMGGAHNRPGARLAMLLAVLVAFGLLTPFLLRAFDGAATPVRIAVAVAVLAPLGLTMGVMFPLGLRLAAGRASDLTAWLWGVNGATSICASVLSVAIALAAGIAASYWTGFACYVVAVGAYFIAARRLSVSKSGAEAEPQSATASSLP